MWRGKWRVKVEREEYGRSVSIKLRRYRFGIFHSSLGDLQVAHVLVSADDFGNRLIEAISEARQKAIELNAGIKSARRRFPSC